MADFDWKSLVGTVSPVLATALGGPLAGAAVKILGDKLLGKSDASEEEVAAALSGNALSGDQIVALKEAERNFDLEMARINQASDAAILADVQSARARQVETKDWMPQLIFGLLLSVYVLEVLMFFYGKMPEDDYTRALMTRAFATVETGLTGAIAYFIGSSRGSKTSGDAIRDIAARKL